MEVRFFLTNQDLWHFQKYAVLRPRTLAALGIFLLIALAVVIVSFTTTTSDFLFNILPFIVLVIVLLPLILLLRMRVGSSTSRSPALQGEHAIIIGPEGFRHRTPVSDATVSWRAIKQITTDQHNLYFIGQMGRLMSAHVIPRRAFATPQHADSYLAWAQTYWAQGPAAPPARPAGTGQTYERWS